MPEWCELERGTLAAMSAAWSIPKRAAFRFGFIYLALYELPWAIKRPLLPDWRRAAESVGAFEGVVRWFGHHVLGVVDPLPKEYPGGGDTLFQWSRVALLLLVATLGAAVWTGLDRKRTGYPLLLDFLRVYVRYGLAFTMLFYGIVKVFPIQFAAPTLLGDLLEPFGNLSPMGLLWKFMGFSRAYTLFSGLVEVLGSALLFWRRTTFLGALLVAVATANVLVLNLSYDVPVKLYSAHLLAMALFLAAPDGVRVLRSLLWRQPVDFPPLREPLPWAQVNRTRPWVKAAVVIWCSFATVFFTLKQGGATRPTPPALYGVWRVESYGSSAPVGTSWHRVVITEWSELAVERLDGEQVRFTLKDDPSVSTASLSNETKKMALKYIRPDADHLVLEGEMDGVPMSLQLRRDSQEFLLTSRGFHWVQEAGLIR